MLCQFRLYCKVNRPYICIYPLPFVLPFHLGHHSALRRVPFAIQYVLISYLFYTQYQQYTCVNLNPPSCPIPLSNPWYHTCSLCLFLYFCFVNKKIKDPLEQEMSACSSILAWRIPWTEEPGGLQSIGSQTVRYD